MRGEHGTRSVTALACGDVQTDAHSTGSSTPRETVTTLKMIQDHGVVSAMGATID